LIWDSKLRELSWIAFEFNNQLIDILRNRLSSTKEFRVEFRSLITIFVDNWVDVDLQDMEEVEGIGGGNCCATSADGLGVGHEELTTLQEPDGDKIAAGLEGSPLIGTSVDILCWYTYSRVLWYASGLILLALVAFLGPVLSTLPHCISGLFTVWHFWTDEGFIWW